MGYSYHAILKILYNILMCNSFNTPCNGYTTYITSYTCACEVNGECIGYGELNKGHVDANHFVLCTAGCLLNGG